MTAALALAAALFQTVPLQDDPPGMIRGIEFASAFDSKPRLWLRIPMDKLDPPKISPKHEWTFEWVLNGMVGLSTEASYPRFRVFSQYRKSPYNEDLSLAVGRFLLRLWDFNTTVLKLDHSPAFGFRSVDVYLCFGGDPGGEHLFDEDPFETDDNGRPNRVNTIYIYQVKDFTDALQWARELAHEYGHATLPPVKFSGAREDWANGDIGERLYLPYLRDQIRAGKLSVADTMGASLAELDAYTAQRVDPLVDRIVLKGPDAKVLAADGQAAFDEYVALVCAAHATLPEAVFRRSLMLNADMTPTGYLRCVAEAAAEAPNWTLRVPKRLSGKAVWLPLGKGKVSGAKVLAKRGDWAKVQPTGVVTVKNPPVD
jgi:hypothetical protein